MMVQKGTLIKRQKTKPTKANRNALLVSVLIFFLGIFIIISSLGYMLINLSKSDSIIKIWTYFIITGVLLVVLSQLIKWLSAREQK